MGVSPQSACEIVPIYGRFANGTLCIWINLIYILHFELFRVNGTFQLFWSGTGQSLLEQHVSCLSYVSILCWKPGTKCTWVSLGSEDRASETNGEGLAVLFFFFFLYYVLNHFNLNSYLCWKLACIIDISPIHRPVCRKNWLLQRHSLIVHQFFLCDYIKPYLW